MGHAVCPWWFGYFLLLPLRKAIQNPENMLGRYVTQGSLALDVGCGMGYFTLPMARLVGAQGRVLAVDLQDRMIRSLQQRAIRAGLSGRIEARVCPGGSLGLDGYPEKVDFALAFAVVHEVPDQGRLLSEIHGALKPGGRLLVAEPRFHVSGRDFDHTLSLAQGLGFTLVDSPHIQMSVSAVLAKDARA